MENFIYDNYLQKTGEIMEDAAQPIGYKLLDHMYRLGLESKMPKAGIIDSPEESAKQAYEQFNKINFFYFGPDLDTLDRTDTGNSYRANIEFKRAGEKIDGLTLKEGYFILELHKNSTLDTLVRTRTEHQRGIVDGLSYIFDSLERVFSGDL